MSIEAYTNASALYRTNMVNCDGPVVDTRFACALGETFEAEPKLTARTTTFRVFGRVNDFTVFVLDRLKL